MGIKKYKPTIERLEGDAWQLQEYRTEAGLKPAVNDAGNRYVEFSDGRVKVAVPQLEDV